MREDGKPITTTQEFKELLMRIRKGAIEAKKDDACDFLSWVQEILIEHPLLEESEDEDGISRT